MKRVAKSVLNASTLDILNVIRENAGYEYQNTVPKVTKATDIPAVGQIIYGEPAIANKFINALVNRIAMVRVQSATFNNPYSVLKKGYIEFGETIEEIFVGIAKVVDYTPEKGEEREFKRTIPDVRSVFHIMNWRTMYPVTIQDEDLKQAFLSLDGVTDLIAKIVDQVYTAAEYDEFLLFKYLLLKAISHGKMKPISVGDGTNPKDSAKAFRGTSNLLTFMKDSYNEQGVATSTPKDRQVIFMDAKFNAEFDVEVLASAFNMDKADFMGRLFLIDDFTTFDNKRFEEIRAHSTGIEEVTDEELALLADVNAVLLDEQWFQVYDNNNRFTEKYVASGLYWNYFYHTWKTVSYSPFANAVVFVKDNATIALPATLTAEIKSKDSSEDATVFTLDASIDGATLEPNKAQFIQTPELTAKGVAVNPYGAVIIPASASEEEITLKASIDGTVYTAKAKATEKVTITASNDVGDTVNMAK
nr:MAG TPA: Head protein [Caudoviricetes sp.]